MNAHSFPMPWFKLSRPGRGLPAPVFALVLLFVCAVFAGPLRAGQSQSLHNSLFLRPALYESIKRASLGGEANIVGGKVSALVFVESAGLDSDLG